MQYCFRPDFIMTPNRFVGSHCQFIDIQRHMNLSGGVSLETEEGFAFGFWQLTGEGE